MQFQQPTNAKVKVMKNSTYSKNMKDSTHFFSMKLNSMFSSVKTLFIVLVLLMGNCAWGQTNQDFSTAGQTTWTVPAGVTSVRVEVWGGGGGATGRISTSYSGAGGGGGTYARKVSFAVTAGDVLYVQVGDGGSGTTAGSNKTANDGGQSYVKT